MRYLPVQQETPYFCGPASLQMVLLRYGIFSEQEKLSSLCRTSSAGTTLDGLRAGAQHFGLQIEVFDDANYDLLSQYVPSEIPVVVSRWHQDDGHYSVVDKITDGHISLINPFYGSVEILERKSFVRTWFTFQGGVYHGKEDLLWRRMLLFYDLREPSKPL